MLVSWLTPPIHAPPELRILAQLPHGQHIARAAAEHALDPWLLAGLLILESRLQAPAHNHNTGAIGVAQFTAGGRSAVARLTRRSFTAQHAADPSKAIPAAALLLSHLRGYCGDLELALGAYNTGRCMRRRSFTRGVLKHANRLRTLAGLPPLPPPRRPHPIRRPPTS